MKHYEFAPLLGHPLGSLCEKTKMEMKSNTKTVTMNIDKTTSTTDKVDNTVNVKMWREINMKNYLYCVETKSKKNKIHRTKGWKTIMLLILLITNLKGKDERNRKSRGNRSRMNDTNLRVDNTRTESVEIEKLKTVEKEIWVRRTETGRRYRDGNTAHTFQRDGNWWKFEYKQEILTNKLRNRNIKMKNGNQNNKILKVAHWNIGAKRWPKKVEEMEWLVEEIEPDLLFISEANLLKNTPNHEKCITGYEMIEPDTVRKYGYARMILLAKKSLKIQVLHEFMDEDISCIWVRVGNKTKKPTHIGGIYREHQYMFQGKPNPSKTERAQCERWHKFVEKWKLAGEGAASFLIGDTNLDMEKWNDQEYEHKRMIDETKQEIETRGWTQIITGTTRAWVGCVDSMLDQCWTNTQNRIISHHNTVRGTSDHNLVSVLVRTNDKNKRQHMMEMRIRKNFNLESYKEKISKIDWTELFRTENVDLANSIFEEQLTKILDQEAPIKNIQQRKGYKSWVEQDTKIMMSERDNKREEARLTKDRIKWDEYKILRNKCTKKLTKDKQAFYERLYKSCESKSDTKTIYKTTRELLHWKSDGGPPESLVLDGKYLQSPTEIANGQLTYYQRKVSKLINELPIQNIDPLHWLKIAFNNWTEKGKVKEFQMKEISDIEMISLISCLGNSTSFGHDMIDSLSVKLVAGSLYRPLRHIVNLSIRTSIFAMKWKMAKVIPLQKSKELNKMDPATYRPVSLLPLVSKLTERACQKQLYEHLESTGQINFNQHAYRQSLSTSTALLQLTDVIYTATDKNMFSQLMALDQSAAFDCVDREILYEKLKMYKISERTMKWIRSYMENRTQYVSIGNKRSRMVPVERGVPQGSVLGPLLYLVYINEMSECIKDLRNCKNKVHEDKKELFGKNCQECGHLPSYADDATYVCTDKLRETNKNKIVKKLKDIKTFLNTNKLTINPGKTVIQEVMIKQKRGKVRGEPPQIEVEKTPGVYKMIYDSKDCKVLGGRLQNNMSWKAHLESGTKALLPSLRSQLGALYHLGRTVPRQSRLTLVNGLIVSRLIYLIPLWGGATENYVKKAQIVLNSAARWATGLGRRTKTLDLMSRCKWMSVKELIEYHSILNMWKTVYKMKPRSMYEGIKIDEDKKLSTDAARLQFTENCYKWRTVQMWNNMKDELRHNERLGSFKIQLRKWISEKRQMDMMADDGRNTP